MSTFVESNVWAISRQKLQRAGADESGDTLRRSVLIHNIIKQHSLPPSPVSYHPHHEQLHHHPYPQSEDMEYEEEEELKAPHSSNVFVFPVIEDYEPIDVDASPASGEQDWLDGLLSDLDDDVHVVPVDDLEHNASDPSFANSSVNFPLFSSSECPQPPQYHQQDSSYVSEAHQPAASNSLFYGLGDDDPTSPPASPPDLMEHNIDSDDDEDDWDPLCSTPSASTDCLSSGRPQYDAEYFFHMPFQRHRPALATHHFNMH